MAEATHHLADVAAKTAWHDSQNTEPLSGASGDVSKGEPFDAGNLDPESQEKLRRSMSGEDNNDHNYTTTGSNSGAQEFEQSVGTGSAPGATFAGGSVTATNMHGVPADKDVPSSTRGTGFGVDSDNSKDLSSNTNTGPSHATNVGSSNTGSAIHTNAGAPVGASTNDTGATNSREAAGAAAGSFAGVNTTSEVPSSTRDTGYGIDPNNSRDLSGSNTGSATQGSGSGSGTFRAQDSPAHRSDNNNNTFRVQDSPAHGSTASHGDSHSSGAGAAAGAAGAAVAGTAALGSSNVNPSTRDTGYGVDPNQSREIGGNTESSGHFRSGAHLHTTQGSTTNTVPNTNTSSSTTHTSGDNRSHSHGLAGAATGAAVGGTAALAGSNVPPTTRDTGYGVDSSQSHKIGGDSTTANAGSTRNTQSANIPVSASAPVGSSSHSSSGRALGTSALGAAAETGSGIPPGTQSRGGDNSSLNTSSTYDGSTRTPSNTVSSHPGAAGAAIGGTAALAGSSVPPTTRDTGYGVDANQSREIESNSNTGATTGTSTSSNTGTGTTYNTHTTTRGTTDTNTPSSPSDEISKAAHDHGAAGAAGAALGLAVGGTSAADSSVPATTRDTGYGIDPAASDGPTGNSAPGFNTITPNSKLANPDGTSRDFSGNNNSTPGNDNSDNASTRALASNSNKDLPSTNPEEEHVDVDGPGPRPVAQVAAEHGGDAGKATSDEVSTTSGKKGLADNTDAPKHEEVKAEGTGEKWVKTSGLAADGGDFDATKPGAGREADRIMEQKGIKTDDDSKDSKSDSKDGKDGKEKLGLVDRIKEKLHKN